MTHRRGDPWHKGFRGHRKRKTPRMFTCAQSKHLLGPGVTQSLNKTFGAAPRDRIDWEFRSPKKRK